MHQSKAVYQALSHDLGAKVQNGMRYEVAGNRYRIGNRGLTAARTIMKISNLIQSPRVVSIWRTADLATSLRSLYCTSFISYVIRETSKPEIRLLAVWLRGFCYGHIGTAIVYKFAKTGNQRLRFRATSTLRRMGASAQLMDIAATETDPRIRSIATRQSPESFSERLNKLKNENTVSSRSQRLREAQPSPLFLLPELDLSTTKPKSAKIIRQILERIRSLVRAPSSSNDWQI